MNLFPYNGSVVWIKAGSSGTGYKNILELMPVTGGIQTVITRSELNAFPDIYNQATGTLTFNTTYRGTYSATATYALGDIVLYSSHYYICNTAIGTAEAWTASKWSRIDGGGGIWKGTYSSTSAYEVGSIVIHSSYYYICKTAVATGGESFNSTKWVRLDHEGSIWKGTYSSSEAYSPGDLVIFNSHYYINKTTISTGESFTASKWVQLDKDDNVWRGTYSATATYAVGDLVLYSSHFYLCSTAILTAEAWDSSKWVRLGKDTVLWRGNYSASNTYAVGEIVTYSNDYYINKTAIGTGETWNSAKWVNITRDPRVWRGAYSSSGTYRAGDIVTNNSNYYINKTAITVGENFTASKWVRIDGGGSGGSSIWKGTYSSSATYAVGDLVLYAGHYYINKTAIGVAEAWTASKWVQLDGGSGGSSIWRGSYSSSNTYAVGDLVSYGGNYYLCKTVISSGELFTASKWVNITRDPRVWQGAYSSSSTYRVGDIVEYSSHYYLCSQAIGTGEAFASSKWVQIDGTSGGGGGGSSIWKGTYSSTSTYSVGDLVVYNSDYYINKTSIGAGEAFNSSKWVNLTTDPRVWRGNYSSSSTYRVGDIVAYSSHYYICKTAVSTGETFVSSKWVQIDGGGSGSSIWRGDYSSSATYAVGDLVLYQTKYYINKTSISTGESFTASKWVHLATDPHVWRGAYSSSGTYRVGDLVSYNSEIYINKTAISSGEAFNSAKWIELSGGNWKGTYSSSSGYEVGDLVLYDANYYINKTSISGGENFTSSKWVLLSGVSDEEFYSASKNVLVSGVNIDIVNSDTNDTVTFNVKSADIGEIRFLSIKDMTVTGDTLPSVEGAGMIGDSDSGIIIGGKTSSGYSDKIFSYTVSGRTVTIDELTKSGTFTSRSDFGIVGSKTSILIYGGMGPQRRGDFVSISISGTTATVSELSLALVNSIPALESVGMVGSTTAGVVFGGYNGSNRFNTFWSYSVSGSTVTISELTKSGSISAREKMAMVGTASSGLIVGGYDGSKTLGDFVRFSVSGSTVTLTTLTQQGVDFKSRDNVTVVGDASSGFIIGGYDAYTNGEGLLSDAFQYVATTTEITLRNLIENSTVPEQNNSAIVGNSNTGLIFGGYVTNAQVNTIRQFTVSATNHVVNKAGDGIEINSDDEISVKLKDDTLSKSSDGLRVNISELAGPGLTADTHESGLFMTGTATDKLYRLNTTTGAATAISDATNYGSLALGNLTGLTWFNNQLYGVNANGNSFKTALYKLSIFTGTAEKVGTLTAFGASEINPTGLATDGTTLWMVGAHGDALYTLNATTGAATKVGTATDFGISGLGTPVGLSYFKSKLYMAETETNALYTLNTTTGVATKVGTATNFGASITNSDGLANDGTTLWMLTGNALYTINETTGVATRVGSSSNFGVSENAARGITYVPDSVNNQFRVQTVNSDVAVESGGINLQFPRWRGNRSPGTNYEPGDIIVNSGIYYICRDNATTFNFYEDKWRRMANAFQGTYATSRPYGIGDIVMQDDHFQICQTAIASGETFDQAKWKEIDGAFASNIVDIVHTAGTTLVGRTKVSSLSSYTKTSNVFETQDTGLSNPALFLTYGDSIDEQLLRNVQAGDNILIFDDDLDNYRLYKIITITHYTNNVRFLASIEKELGTLTNTTEYNVSVLTKNRAGTIVTDLLHDGAVTTAKIAADAVTNAKLADNAVQTENIRGLNVTTAKIANSAVTRAKLGNDALPLIKATRDTTIRTGDDVTTWTANSNASNRNNDITFTPRASTSYLIEGFIEYGVNYDDHYVIFKLYQGTLTLSDTNGLANITLRSNTANASKKLGWTGYLSYIYTAPASPTSQTFKLACRMEHGDNDDYDYFRNSVLKITELT